MLYINGDSHTTAAEANNQFIVAGEDPKLIHLGPLPHPENLAVSWGKLLSLSLRAGFHCAAFSDNTVDKIIADTREWIQDKGTADFVIIQWPAEADSENKIWELHQELAEQNIRHIFFNSSRTTKSDKDWNNCYINDDYETIIQSANIDTVTPNSKHFGKDGHVYWNRLLLNYIIKHKFI